MRFKVAEQDDLKTGFKIHEQIKERKAAVDKRLKEMGVTVVAADEATEYAFRYRIQYDGDMKKLADYIEDIEGAEILSLGHALELIKDLGNSATVSNQYGIGKMKGTHAIGHTRMATESDVDIRSAHPYWAYPYNDIAVVHNGQLTNYWIMRREMERKGHRFMSSCDSELLAVYVAHYLEKGETARGRAERVHQGHRWRLHLSRDDQGRYRHGQGHHGGQAHGALRERQHDLPRLGRDGDPRRAPAGDRHLGPL